MTRQWHAAGGALVLLLLAAPAAAQVPLQPGHWASAPVQIRRTTPSPLPPAFVLDLARFQEPPDEVQDRAAYLRAKDAAARGDLPRSGHALPPPRLAEAPAPTVELSRAGVARTGWYPADGNGAIGLNRYVEIANGGYAIYDRAGRLLDGGGLDRLTGDSGDLYDPSVLWDPQSRRFYYVIVHNRGYAGTRSYYNFGYSVDATPSSAADFCHYVLDWNYADEGLWTDYARMGTTRDFIVFTGNLFPSAPGMFVRADAQWLAKPSAARACDDPAALRAGVVRDLRDAAGNAAYAVQPARQVDPRATGWLISAVSAGASELHLFRVRPDASGAARIERQARPVAVQEYTIPPDAPQRDSSESLDTGGSLLSTVTSAVDPSRGGVNTLWTTLTNLAFSDPNQTIAVIDWYEIDPQRAQVLQSGRLGDPQLYLFNGAIAPDRVVRGRTRAFGDAMVLGFNTSSTATALDVAVVSKIGDAALSARRVVRHSRAGYTCGQDPCRWGDYASASADPAADATQPHGRVWITSQSARDEPGFNAWEDRNARVAP